MGKLTIEQKNLNHELTGEVVVEHAICKTKRLRIKGEEFRNRLRGYDRAANITSGSSTSE